MNPGILLIGPKSPPTGGMETCIEDILKSQRLRKNYRIFHMPTNKPRFYQKVPALKPLLVAYRALKMLFMIPAKRIDLVHLHTACKKSFPENLTYYLASKITGCKIIWHVHGATFDNYYKEAPFLKKAIIKQSFNHAERVIALSDYWKGFISKFATKEKIAVLRNSVPTQKIGKNKKTGNKILFLSRLCQRKGIYDILKAAKIVQRKAEFILVGPADNLEEYKNIAEEYGISGHVKFIGEKYGNDRYPYFLEADIFILPSYAEGLPIALLEAMSFGLAVITTNVGAIPEVVENGVNGYRIKPGDQRSLARYILKLSKNRKLRHLIAKNNLSKINNEFSNETYNENLASIYRSVLQ